jgi:hypothetical protein
VRNEDECVCSVCLFRCNILIGFRIIKEMPGSVGSGTPYTIHKEKSNEMQQCIKILLFHIYMKLNTLL